MPLNPRISRRLPDSVRSRLDVASAMAWESLVETHVAHAFHFLELLDDRMALEDALTRYLLEMDLGESMAQAIRNSVLVSLDEPEEEAGPDDEAGGDDDGWRRFRPDVVMKGVRERQRRQDETETLIELALARAEEAIITTHVDNAITFAALLDELLPLGGAVRQYLYAVDLSGGRAQAVFQRTMARLAEVHLPRPVASRG